MSTSSREALLGLLDDRDPRPSGDCVGIVFRQQGDVISEGESEEWSRCRRQQQSNARRTLELLRPARPEDPRVGVACRQLLAFVDDKPEHSDSLRESIHDGCHD